MKDYNQVVKDRFDKQTDDELTSSIYSETHPIGKYSHKYLYKAILTFIEWYKKSGTIENQTILDLGCGHGKIIHFFAHNGFQEINAHGIDFSEVRINRAKSDFPSIHFEVDDALNFQRENKKFNLITSFDLFSHFSTKEELEKGITNVYNHLVDDGHFLWYDIYAKDHYSSVRNADSSGFSKKQMVDLATDCGFELVYYKPVFKLLLNKYHSIYQAKRCPESILRILEKVLPGSPGNMLMVFKKK